MSFSDWTRCREGQAVLLRIRCQRIPSFLIVSVSSSLPRQAQLEQLSKLMEIITPPSRRDSVTSSSFSSDPSLGVSDVSADLCDS